MNNIRLVGVIIYLLRFGYLMDSNAEALIASNCNLLCDGVLFPTLLEAV